MNEKGFAYLKIHDLDKMRAICSLGGKKSHELKRAHEFTSAEARNAGRKGGIVSARKRKEKLDGTSQSN